MVGYNFIATVYICYNEIITDQENGLIIKTKNENAIFAAMETLFTDENAVSKMKNNSRKVIIEKFEQQLVWDAILEEYQQLVHLMPKG